MCRCFAMSKKSVMEGFIALLNFQKYGQLKGSHKQPGGWKDQVVEPQF